MTYSQERDEFLGLVVKEGLPVDIARTVLRHATTLQRIAELECSSERADRDRVPCPGVKRDADCICDWDRDLDRGQHRDVKRIERQAQRIEARLIAGLAKYPGFAFVFGGDPRGGVVRLKVPSGAYNTWGGAEDGIAVPARGFTAAQMERISR